MFEKIRKPFRAKTIISYIIFSVICLVFVFIGVPSQQMSSLGGAALIVNNQVISWSEYQDYLELLRSQLAADTSTQLEAKRQKQLRTQAIDALLNTELMVQQARARGVVVSDLAVRDRIVRLSVFKEDGRFSRQRYYSFLSARRWSATHFENKIQRELQVTRLQQLFHQAVSTSQVETNKNQRLSAFRTRVHYVSFPSNSIREQERQFLTEWIQQGKEDLLNQMVKDKNWEWEQTEEFDLSRRFLPGLPSFRKLFDEVVRSAPQGGLISKIIKIKDQSFVLKVEPFYQKTSDSKNVSERSSVPFFTDRIMGRMFFLSWMESVRARAKLKWNPRLQNTL